MNELGIFENNGRAVVSSRDVARVFEKRHNDVLRDIRVLGASEDFRLRNFAQTPYVEKQNGQTYNEYLLTRDGFTILAMGYTGEKAMRFKEAYIAAFNEMERRLSSPPLLTGAELLARAVIEAQSMISERDTQIAKQQAYITEAEPKVLFANAVSCSDGTILIGELAKILKGNGIDIGEKRLFERLRQDGFLIKRNGTDRNAPSQRSMELGLFKIIERTITHSDGQVTIAKTTKVTGKGQEYFVNYFLADMEKAS